MTVQEYVAAVPEGKAAHFRKLRSTIKRSLPKGFREVMSYGMIGYVVPHALYPAGYHCNPAEPLPFMGLASQKGAITFYHMGLYSNRELMEWFLKKYAALARHKIDIGKSCIRFKYWDEIPYDAIGELVRRIGVRQWIREYEAKLKKKP